MSGIFIWDDNPSKKYITAENECPLCKYKTTSNRQMPSKDSTMGNKEDVGYMYMTATHRQNE